MENILETLADIRHEIHNPATTPDRMNFLLGRETHFEEQLAEEREERREAADRTFQLQMAAQNAPNGTYLSLSLSVSCVVCPSASIPSPVSVSDV